MRHISEITKKYSENGCLPDLPAAEPKIPRRRTLAELDTSVHPRMKRAVDMARSWQRRRREQPNASLVLVAAGVTGPDGKPDLLRTGYGCGKTHIALACLWSVCYMLDDEPVAPAGKFFLAEQLVANLAADTPPAAELGNAPIVVIDDVGAEGTIPYVAKESQDHERHARYFKAVNHCYERGVSVIITGNLRMDDLAYHIGGRAWSRLLQMAPRGYMLDMTGVPDWRRREGGR